MRYAYKYVCCPLASVSVPLMPGIVSCCSWLVKNKKFSGDIRAFKKKLDFLWCVLQHAADADVSSTHALCCCVFHPAGSVCTVVKRATIRLVLSTSLWAKSAMYDIVFLSLSVSRDSHAALTGQGHGLPQLDPALQRRASGPSQLPRLHQTQAAWSRLHGASRPRAARDHPVQVGPRDQARIHEVRGLDCFIIFRSSSNALRLSVSLA